MARQRRKHRKHRNPPPGCGLPPIRAKKKGMRVTWDNIDRPDYEPDPQKTAREARLRMVGGTDTREGRKALLSPLKGSALGCVIEARVEKASEAARLWNLWLTYCRVSSRFHMLKYGTTGHPKIASLIMVPDSWGDDDAPPVDLRTDQERLDHATASYDWWAGLIDGLSRVQMDALYFARAEGQGPTLWRDQAPTRYGLVTLAALQALAESYDAATGGR